MKRKLILFGTGEYADVARFYFEREGSYDVVAFTATASHLHNVESQGLAVHPFETIEESCPPANHMMFVAVAYSQLNKTRAAFFHQAKAKGYSLATYISPKATYYGTPVGENSFIFEDNTIQPFTRIGNNAVLWSGNHIGHHARIGSHVFLASHVVISGGVVVEDYSFIGVNVTVRDHVTIGAESIIGAGSLIMKDVEPKSVYSTPRTRMTLDDSGKVAL